MGRKTLLIGVFAAFTLAGVFGWLYSCQKKATVPVSYGTPALWERILDEPGVLDVPDSTRAVIMPHHLIAATELTKFYRGMAKQFHPKTIFLVGPNHFEEGKAAIQTCDCAYSTIEGQLNTNAAIVQEVIKSGLAVNNNQPFKKEHSIYAHATFIKYFFPETEIVPLILKWETSDEKIDELVTFINSLSDKQDILTIASVDFSHYLPHLSADFHDESSFTAIQNFDQNSIKTIEVDSPASVRFITRWAEQRGLMKVSLLNHTNSQDFFHQKKLEKTTSHQFISFSDGEIEKASQVSIHFFGDAMFGREIKEALNNEDILSILAGDEDRFFLGNDYNILNLEGVLGQRGEAQNKSVVFNFNPKQVLTLLQKYGFNAVNMANNHSLDYFLVGDADTRYFLNEADVLSFGAYETGDKTCSTVKKNNLKIALCGLNDVGEILPVESSLKIISEARKNHDLVFLSIHWGEEYANVPTVRQESLAHRFIDAGVDLIIGHHPHVVQPLEIYKERPIFYSLGNFVFDQIFPEGVETGLSIGVVASNNKINLYLLPFHTNGGKPILFNSVENQGFLNQFLQGLERYQVDIPGKLEIVW